MSSQTHIDRYRLYQLGYLPSYTTTPDQPRVPSDTRAELGFGRPETSSKPPQTPPGWRRLPPL